MGPAAAGAATTPTPGAATRRRLPRARPWTHRKPRPEAGHRARLTPRGALGRKARRPSPFVRLRAAGAERAPATRGRAPGRLGGAASDAQVRVRVGHVVAEHPVGLVE